MMEHAIYADNQNLNHGKFVIKDIQGERPTMVDESHTSHNRPLNLDDTTKKALTTDYIRRILEGIPNL